MVDMMAGRLLLLHGHRAICSAQLYTGVRSWVRVASGNSPQGVNSTKPPLKKSKTPQGRLDDTEQSSFEKEPLERFPNDINVITKERGGPRGPEPTRYGDWERKGRCIDF